MFDILGEYRQTIKELQLEFLSASHSFRRVTSILLAKTIDLLSNDTRQRAEIDALYNGVQHLMSGTISHFILPHDMLTNALTVIQEHLDVEQPHLTLSRHDCGFYYSEASFKTFRRGNVLFLVSKAPVTMRLLLKPFHLYNVLKLPMITPEKDVFYCMLATNIKAVAFVRDAHYIIQITEGNDIPPGIVWKLGNTAFSFMDRDMETCARALVDGHLVSIKVHCRYSIFKSPCPHGVITLGSNVFLLTNISTIRMHCFGQKFRDNITEHVIHLTELQVVKTLDCHCDRVMADEFRIIVDQDVCNNSWDISAVVNLKFPINLAYLTEYFDMDELYNITANTLLNYSVEVQLPKLAIADRFLDAKFAREHAISIDMEEVINATKTSGTVYENLAHYLFNNMIHAHTLSNDFDLLSLGRGCQ